MHVLLTPFVSMSNRVQAVQDVVHVRVRKLSRHVRRIPSGSVQTSSSGTRRGSNTAALVARPSSSLGGSSAEKATLRPRIRRNQ